MIVAKAPLRISLFGGGTDLPEFREKHGSTIINMAINRYMHVVWNDRPTGGYRLSYSEVEELCSLTTAKHTIVKTFVERYPFTRPCTLSIISDVPKGTGLGSSSALTVALCTLLNQKEGIERAQLAYEIERSVAPVGIQDHLPASLGGFRCYSIGDEITSILVPVDLDALIHEYGLLLYTGETRSATDVLQNWKDESILLDIKDIADDVSRNISMIDFDDLVTALRETWWCKMSIPGVVNDMLRAQYSLAIHNGAVAGKLLGAGAGGCWFFLVSPELRQQVMDTLNLPEIPFSIAEKGAQVYGF